MAEIWTCETRGVNHGCKGRRGRSRSTMRCVDEQDWPRLITSTEGIWETWTDRAGLRLKTTSFALKQWKADYRAAGAEEDGFAIGMGSAVVGQRKVLLPHKSTVEG